MATNSKFTVLLTLLISFSGFSQEITEQNPNINGIERQIHYLKADDYFTFRSNTPNTLDIEHVTNNQIVSKNAIAFPKGMDRVHIEYSFLEENQLNIFYRTVKSNVDFKLYMVRVDLNCKTVGEPLVLNELKVYDKKYGEEEVFTFTESENKSFLCVLQKSSSTNGISYSYNVFNSKIESVRKGGFTIPANKSNFRLDNTFLSTSGDFYFGFRLDRSNENSYRLCKAMGDQVEEMDIFTGSGRISSMKFATDASGKLTCAGIFGEGSKDAAGFFVMKIDLQNKKIEKEDFTSFENLTIVQNWDSKNYRGWTNLNKSEPFEYQNLYFDISENGSITAAFVQSYNHFVGGTTVPQGSNAVSHDSRYVYLNDVVVFHVSADASNKWNTLIPYASFQMSNGFFGGIGYITAEKFVLLLDDNVNKYDAAGNYLPSEDTEKNATMYIAKNGIAKIAFDLNNGNMERSRIFPKSAKGNYTLCPFGYYYDKETGTIQFGMNANGLRIGVIR